MEAIEQAFVFESRPYNFAVILTDSDEARPETVWNHSYRVIHASVENPPIFREVTPSRMKEFVESRKPCGWHGMSPFMRDRVLNLIEQSGMSYTIGHTRNA